MSSEEAKLLPVLLCEADESLPDLAVGADGLAEFGDNLRMERDGLSSELVEPLLAQDVARDDDEGSEHPFALVDVPHPDDQRPTPPLLLPDRHHRKSGRRRGQLVEAVLAGREGRGRPTECRGGGQQRRPCSRDGHYGHGISWVAGVGWRS